MATVPRVGIFWKTQKRSQIFPETGQNDSRTIGGIEHGVTKGKCKRLLKQNTWNGTLKDLVMAHLD